MLDPDVSKGGLLMHEVREQLDDLIQIANEGLADALFAEDPIEVFARQVWVSPYYEDDLHDLKAKGGADHMLFGSDWPHAEGLRNPVDFVADLDGFDSAEVEQIMRTNGLALAARAV